MKKNNIFFKLLATIPCAFALAFVSTDAVFAEETPDYRLQVSPTYANIEEIEPGKTESGSFKVQNTGAKELKYEIEVTPYSVSGEEYNLDSATMTPYTKIAEWITITPKSGTLAADSQQEVKYTINVPKDAVGGGQYALINIRLVQEDQDSDKTAISASKQVGFRLLTTIDGEVNRKGQVVEQKINGILFNPPIIATSTVENTGNTHIKASYVLQVYPLGSDEEVYTNEENPTTLTLLPETRRFNSISWDGAPHLGLFRVKQTITVGDNAPAEIEKLVFLCPIWLLFIVLLIIFCLIFWVVSRVKTRK